MIVSSCPLRISLIGGGTDHPKFLEKYGYGSVISFPSNLRVYASIHQDIFGATASSKYVLNYSSREEVQSIDLIKNELIRLCFEELSVGPINLFLTSDVYSSGSGLATSSAYLIALISAIWKKQSKSHTDTEVCETAISIERKFNHLVGRQDFYGSICGFKKIEFTSSTKITQLPEDIFDQIKMWLVPTGIVRSSTKILEVVDIDANLVMLDYVYELEKAILENNLKDFCDIMNIGWSHKKKTSSMILENDKVAQLDLSLSEDEFVLAHKLLGAGNGGYFLVITNKFIKYNGFEIYPSSGFKCHDIR